MNQASRRQSVASLDAGARTLELLEGAHRYNHWIFDRVRGPLGHRLLEIGCGTGTITAFLADRELVVGLDVVEEYVRLARDRFRQRSNVVILLQDLTQSVEELLGYRFDSAVSVNVFEHIPDDVTAMKGVHRVLMPGGRFSLLVPSHPALMGPFDRNIGHYRRYTKRDLGHKLELAGFRVECIRRSNPVGALGWFLNIRLLRQRALRGVELYDCLVPALARLDKLVEFPLGLSLTAVARKP